MIGGAPPEMMIAPAAGLPRQAPLDGGDPESMYRLAPWLVWALIGCSPLDDVSVGSDGGVGEDIGAPSPPPPISGGTLEATADGRLLVISDPETERVHVVDVIEGSERDFRADAPGRVALSPTHAYVVQHGGGLLQVSLAVDPDGHDLRVLRTCEGPRGVAHHDGRVVVTCLGGELVEVDLDGRGPTVLATLGPDLRDVVRHAGAWWVSRFRPAELYRVDERGEVTQIDYPLPALERGDADEPAPAARVGWRLRPLPGGRLGFLYQLHSTAVLATHESGYMVDRAGCAGPVVSALTIFDAGGAVEQGVALGGAVLTVDFAAVGAVMALAVAGAQSGGHHRLFQDIDWVERWGSCAQAEPLAPALDDPLGGRRASQITAVAAAGETLYVQDRANGVVMPLAERGRRAPQPLIEFAAPPAVDPGHDVFHRDAGRGIACASCHPLGADDGHVWRVAGEGERRTLSLRGGLVDTLPLHWQGEFADLAALLSDVFTLRMGGGEIDPLTVDALSAWIESLSVPTYTVEVDSALRAAGAQLFEGTCAGCHAGVDYSDNALHLVEAGEFATPPLRELWLRGSLFHTGCEGALDGAEAFFVCAEAAHGAAVTDEWALTPAQRVELFEFVKTL